MYAVKVPKLSAESVRARLYEEKVLDRSRMIEDLGKYLIIPVTRKIEAAYPVIEYEGIERKHNPNPITKIRTMANVPEAYKALISAHWEKYGHVLIVKVHKSMEDYKYDLAKAYAEALKVDAVLQDKGGIEGEYRVPKLELLLGSDTETTHIENGVLYRFDSKNIMFSSGNVNERIRMSKIDVTDETIIDMFAGIGYFSLPIAKYQNPKFIYCCELNPLSFQYLKQNLILNNVNSIVPFMGDNREFNSQNFADRVIMGYINTEPFLPYALQFLKHRKGILHFHNTWTTEELKAKDQTLDLYAEKYRFEYSLNYFSVVKSYAPHIWHIVADLEIL